MRVGRGVVVKKKKKTRCHLFQKQNIQKFVGSMYSDIILRKDLPSFNLYKDGECDGLLFVSCHNPGCYIPIGHYSLEMKYAIMMHFAFYDTAC